MKKAFRTQFGQLLLKVTDPKFKHNFFRDGDYILRVWDEDPNRGQCLISYFPSVKNFMVGALRSTKKNGFKLEWASWVKGYDEVLDLIEEALDT